MSKINTMFPGPEEVVVLKEPSVAGYLYSLWLGISLPLLNLPRLFLVGLFRGLGTILMDAIVMPIVSVILCFLLGTLGRLSNLSDLEKGKPFKLMALSDGRRVARHEGSHCMGRSARLHLQVKGQLGSCQGSACLAPRRP